MLRSVPVNRRKSSSQPERHVGQTEKDHGDGVSPPSLNGYARTATPPPGACGVRCGAPSLHDRARPTVQVRASWWNRSVVGARLRVVPTTLRVATCLLATIVVSACASGANRPLDDSTNSGSTLGHGSLTNHEFDVAVAVARSEADKDAATITSATATVGVGTVADPNDGPPCTSGTLLHIKLIGTFPTISVGQPPTAGAASAADHSVSTVLITADPESGKACALSVQTGSTSPDPGATVLFTK